MIRAWLDLPAPQIFLVLIALYFGVSAVLIIATALPPLARPIRSLKGVVAPFFTSVAILFALLTGFLGSDIGDRNRLANRAVQMEAAELRNVHTLSVASVSDMQAIRIALKAYAASVVTDEWPAMSHGESSPKTNAAFDQLLREVSDPRIGRDSGEAVQSALLTAAIRVGSARNDRIALSSDATNTLKWLSVLLLGVITQVAIALVHIDQSARALAAALATFSVAAVVALGFIALQEYPFEGAFGVSREPIAKLTSLSVTLNGTPPVPMSAQPPAPAKAD